MMLFPKVCPPDLHPLFDGPTVTFVTFTSHEAVQVDFQPKSGSRRRPTAAPEPNSHQHVKATLRSPSKPSLRTSRQTCGQKRRSRHRMAQANSGLLCWAASRIPAKLRTLRVAWAWPYMICVANTRLLGSIPAAQNQGKSDQLHPLQPLRLDLAGAEKGRSSQVQCLVPSVLFAMWAASVLATVSQQTKQAQSRA